jgi:hypothetical protein
MDLPIVPVVHVGHGGRPPTFGHDGVGLAQERLADQPDRDPTGRGLDRGPEAGTAGPDYQDVVVVGLEVGQRIRQSVQMPIEQSRT